MSADLKDDAGHAAVGTMLPPDDARFVVAESFLSIFLGKFCTLISMLHYTNAALKYLWNILERKCCVTFCAAAPNEKLSATFQVSWMQHL